MKIDYKKIVEELIPIFEEEGQESIDLYNKGLKIEIKELKSIKFKPFPKPHLEIKNSKSISCLSLSKR